MSSILDALNKLEAEKLRAQEALKPEDINSADAVDDLLGAGDRGSKKMNLQISPLMLIGGAVFTLLVLVGLITFIVATVMKPDPLVPPVASNPQPTLNIPVPAPEPPIETPAEPVPTESVDMTPPTPLATNPTVEDPAPAEPVQATSVPAVKIEKKPEPLPKPATTNLEETGPLDFSASNTKKAPTQAAPKALQPTMPQEDIVVASEDKPIHMYPRFSSGVQLKYGLETFKVNMVSPQSARNPYGSAIINRKKIFEGGFIDGSQVMLYKVEREGLCFEIPHTGKRYYLNF